MARQRLEFACICGQRITVAIRKGDGFYTTPSRYEDCKELVIDINSFFGEHEYCAGSPEQLPYRLTTESIKGR